MRESIDINTFRTKPAAPAPVATEGFGIDGKPVDPAADGCLARMTPGKNGQALHEIMLSGENDRRPFDVFTDDPAKLRGRTGHGTPRWALGRVTEDVYKLYRRFLQTQDPSFLREAKRSI